MESKSENLEQLFSYRSLNEHMKIVKKDLTKKIKKFNNLAKQKENEFKEKIKKTTNSKVKKFKYFIEVLSSFRNFFI